MAERCPVPLDGCQYAGTPECIITRHHLYYYATDYQEPVAKAFRDLPENSEYLPRCEHDELHATTEPPEKPDFRVMAEVVLSNSQFISRRLAKELKKELRNG
jgi:hypothetical protein